MISTVPMGRFVLFGIISQAMNCLAVFACPFGKLSGPLPNKTDSQNVLQPAGSLPSLAGGGSFRIYFGWRGRRNTFRRANELFSYTVV